MFPVKIILHITTAKFGMAEVDTNFFIKAENPSAKALKLYYYMIYLRFISGIAALTPF